MIKHWFQAVVVAWQRWRRGFSDLDVERYHDKMEKARDRGRNFSMNKYEFAAMQATVYIEVDQDEK